MRLLYVSSHSVGEYDDLRMFHELGLQVFSSFAYANPMMGGLRPPLSFNYDPDDLEAHDHFKDCLHPEFVKRFDIVFFHGPFGEYLTAKWDVIKDRRVIVRTNGQSTPRNEMIFKELRKEGLQVVRYSPTERVLYGYAGEDAMIRFYKDPEEWKAWNGTDKTVITIAKGMKKRERVCLHSVFDEVTQGLPRRLYGADNQGVEGWAGELNYLELKGELRANRVFFYTGTRPASYTLGFIEAWMTGIPIVAVGPSPGNHPFSPTYEVHHLLKHGESGLWANNLSQLRDHLREVLANEGLAKRLSANGRTAAVQHFGKQTIYQQWKEFLTS